MTRLFHSELSFSSALQRFIQVVPESEKIIPSSSVVGRVGKYFKFLRLPPLAIMMPSRSKFRSRASWRFLGRAGRRAELFFPGMTLQKRPPKLVSATALPVFWCRRRRRGWRTTGGANERRAGGGMGGAEGGKRCNNERPVGRPALSSLRGDDCTPLTSLRVSDCAR